MNKLAENGSLEEIQGRPLGRQSVGIHILHVNRFFFPFVAGPSRRILDVVRHVFTHEKHSVLTFDKTEHLPAVASYEGIPVRRFPMISNYEIHRLFHFGIERNGLMSDFVRHVRDEKPSCIALYWIGMIPRLVSRALPEVRTVYTPFTFVEEEFDPLFRSPRMKIVLFEENCVNRFLDAGVNPKQIVVLQKPIDTHLFRPINVSRDRSRLLYVGRLHPTKQLPQLIRVLGPLFHDVPHLHLHIVADLKPILGQEKTDAEIERIKKIAREVGVFDRVILRGKCVGNDLLREYSQAAIHVLPSKAERKNTATQEALAMGLHCVNLRKQFCDWPEFRPDGERLIHYVDRLEDFDAVIRNLLESDSRPDHRDFIEKNWSWHRWRPEYEKLFAEW